MTSIESCKRIIDQCKYMLKIEKDPVLRKQIAEAGINFNHMMLGLSKKKEVDKMITKLWGIKKRN